MAFPGIGLRNSPITVDREPSCNLGLGVGCEPLAVIHLNQVEWVSRGISSRLLHRLPQIETDYQFLLHKTAIRQEKFMLIVFADLGSLVCVFLSSLLSVF